MDNPEIDPRLTAMGFKWEGGRLVVEQLPEGHSFNIKGMNIETPTGELVPFPSGVSVEIGSIRSPGRGRPAITI